MNKISRLQADNIKLNQQLDELRKEKEALEIQLEFSSLKGEFNPATTKAIHFEYVYLMHCCYFLRLSKNSHLLWVKLFTWKKNELYDFHLIVSPVSSIFFKLTVKSFFINFFYLIVYEKNNIHDL